MKVAHIVPTPFLSLLVKHDYLMALCHIVEEDDAYANWHKSQAARGAYVILDNGVEEGLTRDIVSLLNAADLVHASEIVLPDVFRSCESTAITLTALDSPLVATAREHGVKFAAVVHGTDRSSWIQSFDTLSAEQRIDTIMLPKVLDEVWGYGGRFAAAAYLQATGRINPSKHYHLLGIWTDPVEVYLHAVFHKWIRGLDTSLAFQAGFQEVALTYITREGGHKPRRPHSYFNINHLDNVQSALVHTNIARLDAWGRADGRA